jgi:hypothetical protein
MTSSATWWPGGSRIGTKTQEALARSASPPAQRRNMAHYGSGTRMMLVVLRRGRAHVRPRSAFCGTVATPAHSHLLLTGMGLGATLRTNLIARDAECQANSPPSRRARTCRRACPGSLSSRLVKPRRQTSTHESSLYVRSGNDRWIVADWRTKATDLRVNQPKRTTARSKSPWRAANCEGAGCRSHRLWGLMCTPGRSLRGTSRQRGGCAP